MEFQVVLLAAGRGSRLSPLNDSTPKCLLPIGNFPAIWYPLRTLELAGFKEVKILVLIQYKDAIKRAIDDMPVQLRMTLTYCTIPDDDEGTAISLQKIVQEQNIEKDLLIVSCDLITNTSLDNLIKLHRRHDASLTCLLRQQVSSECKVPGSRSADKSKETSFIGLDGNRLLLVKSEADVDAHIAMSDTAILEKHPSFQIYTDLEDCHLYLLSHTAVKDCLARGFHSIQSELVPYLVDKQFRKRRDRLGSTSNSAHDLHEKAEPVKGLSMELAMKYSSWTDHGGDMEEPYHGSKIRCFARIANEGLCLRTNTIADFYEANRQIGKFMDFFELSDNTYSRKMHQVDSSSLIAAGFSILGDRSSITKSNIGKECVIKDNVKITNCVIMNKVNIQEGCTLESCIVCEEAQIGERSNLKECIIGARQRIEPASKYSKEVLADADEADF